MHLSIIRSPRLRNRQKCAGGVMVVALMITAAATMGFAAWTTLVASRKEAVEQNFGGLLRRMAVENGRLIARQLAYTDYLTKNASNAVDSKNYVTGTTQVIGGISAPLRVGFPMDSVAFPAGFSRISPAGLGYAYGVITNVSVPFSVMDSHPSLTVRENSSTVVSTALKSRSPLLSGDLLVIHKPTLATTSPVAAPVITGNLDVLDARAVFLTPDSLANFSTVRASAVSTPTYTVPLVNPFQTRDPYSNSVILPSNFPSLLTTTGSVGAGNNLDTQHYLNVVDSAQNPSNSFREKIKTGSYVTVPTTADFNQSGVNFVSSTGVLTLDLSNVALPGVIAQNNVSQIVFTGQTSSAEEGLADIYSSVGVCYVEDAAVSTRTLTSVVCKNGANKRRLILGMKKIPNTTLPQVPGSPVVISFPQSNLSPVWRLLLVAENTPLTFSNSGGAGTITLKGGIQTDGNITSTSGAGNAVKLISETDPRRLSRLAPRHAWVETYLDFTNGSL